MRFHAVSVSVVGAAALLFAACGGGPAGPTPPPPPPGVTNTAPIVRSITTGDTRVEVGTPVALTAVVEDAETPVANLTYAWSAANGTFAGTGAQVTWTPGPDAATPGDFVVTLTVTERYTSGSQQLENKASGTITLHVNNSPKELAELSLRFLGDFADSKVSPDRCVAEFSTTSDRCVRGKAEEFDDIFANRHDLLILSSTLRHTSLSIEPSRVNATVHTFCSFTSRVISRTPLKCIGCQYDSVATTSGDCYTTSVYEKGRWWLCESHYNAFNAATAFELALERALGLRRSESSASVR